ncbi:hypothetical protein JCM17961_24830 [Endothiovibrio diazotrophicus]
MLLPLLWSPLSHAEEAPAAKPAAAATPLNRLDNDRLISQAEEILRTARERYAADVRGLSHIQRSIDRGMEAIDAEAPLDSPAQGALPASLEQVDQRLGELDAYAKQLDGRRQRLERQAGLFDQALRQVDAVLRSLEGLIERLRGLRDYAFEAQMRVRDATLAEQRLPEWLNERRLIQGILRRHKMIARWQQRRAELNELQAALATRLERQRQTIAEAQETGERIHGLRTKLQHEQEMAARYREEPEARLRNRLAVLRFSKERLAVAFARAREGFAAGRQGVAPLVQAFEEQVARAIELTPNGGEVGILDQAAVAREAQRVDGLAQALQARQTAFEAYRGALEKARKGGELAIAKGTTLIDLQRQINVLLRVLPEESAAEQATLGREEKAARTALAELEPAVKAVRQELDGLAGEAQREQALADGVRAQRYRVQRLERAMERLAWQAPEGLETVAKEELLSRFRTLYNDSTDLAATLQERAAAVSAARNAVAEAQAALDGGGHAAPAAEGHADDGLEAARHALMQAARLDAPPPVVAAPAAAPPVPKAEADAAEAESAAAPEPDGKAPSLFAAMTPVVQAYQGSLIDMREAIVGRRDRRHRLAQALDHQVAAAEAYLEAQQRVSQNLNDRFALAEMIQARLSAEELEGFDLAEEVAETLRNDGRAPLQAELLRHYFDLTVLRQRQGVLPSEEASEAALLSSLEQLNDGAGQRLGALQKWQKIQEQIDQGADGRSETEQEALGQMAWRRLEAENRPLESLLSILPSERGATLDKLLHRFYLEVLELERRDKLLGDQSRVVAELTASVDGERKRVGELLPVLKERREALDRDREVLLAVAEARLAPEQADDRFQALKAQSGIELTPVAYPVLADDEKRAVIDATLHTLSGLRARQAAIDGWVKRLEPRAEEGAGEPEQPRYREAAGLIEGQIAATARQIRTLGPRTGADGKAVGGSGARGGSPAAIGEIGHLRDERLGALEQSGLAVALELAAIVLIAPLLFLAARLHHRRALKRIEGGELEEKDKDQRRLLASFWYGMARFAVWAGVILSILSVLGFNVGALLAGLGIGGLAVAMALRSTLADIIGGLNLLWTRFMQVGDLVEFKGRMYAVKEIGLRYSQLTDFSRRHVMLIPNALLSEIEVKKISAHPGMRMTNNLILPLESTAEQHAKAMDLVRQTLEEHAEARLIFVRHDGLQEKGFQIKFGYDIALFQNRNRVMTEVQLRLIELCTQAGISYAKLPVSVEMTAPPTFEADPADVADAVPGGQ